MQLVQNQDEQVLKKQNVDKMRTNRNKFILLVLINVFVFVMMFLSAIYYQWIHLKLKLSTSQQMLQMKQISLNFLYLKLQKHNNYLLLSSSSKSICSGDLRCQDQLTYVIWVCHLSLLLLLTASFLQIYYFASIIPEILNKNLSLNYKYDSKDVLVVLIHIFVILLAFVQFKIFCIYDSHFGICFWITFIAVFIQIGVSWNKYFTFKEVIKQSMIIELMDQQKEIHERRKTQTNNHQQQSDPDIRL